MTTYSSINNEFEQELEANLSTYTTILPEHFASDANLFSTRKEIAIARYALSSQALAYQAAMQLLLDQLDYIRQQGSQNTELFRNIMTLLAGIEQKSKALIESAKQVTELLGKAVEIDVDKAALRTLLVNTPAILSKTIERVSGNPELAQQISLSFNNQINELMIQFRLDRHNDDALLPAGQSGQQQQAGFHIEDLQQLMNSVPSQPDGLSHYSS